MLGTGLLLGQALENAWDKPGLGTGPSKCLVQAKMLGEGSLLGQTLPNAWDRSDLGSSLRIGIDSSE